MNDIIFLVLMLVLVFMIVQNARLFKRNKHIKNYIKCSDAVFNDDPEMVEIAKAYVEAEGDEEFTNKGRVIYIYALLHHGLDAKTEVAKLDLKETILNKKEKFDAKKFEYNSDTYFWLIVTLIKAYSLNEKEVVEGLVNAVAKHYDLISQDIVTQLFFSIHHCLAADDKADMSFLRDLWSGVYPANCTYDKRLIGFYKYLAVASLSKLGDELSEEMTTDVRNFAAMKVGRVVLRDYGILENFTELPIENDEPFVDDAEEVVTEEEPATEEVAEDTKDEAE